MGMRGLLGKGGIVSRAAIKLKKLLGKVVFALFQKNGKNSMAVIHGLHSVFHGLLSAYVPCP
jgi:hypothetical protein